MKKYGEYQTSPVIWNKQFPGHWNFERGKNLYRKENRKPLQTDDIVTCFRDGVVTLRKNRRTTGFTESLKEIGYQGVRKGDLVIHVMDAFAGSIGVSDSDGKGTPVYSVCTAKTDINNYYYAYLLRDVARRGYIQSLYRGIRERSSDFRFDVFAAQYYPVPPRSEQDQIVRFLDWKVSEINRLINIKKQQKRYFDEEKLSMITKIVTKGLDAKTQLKDSGNIWVGEIPCDWDMVSIGRVYKLILGKMLTPQKKNESDYLMPYFCAKDVHFDGADKSNLKEMWFQPFEMKQYKVEDEDLLIVEGGAGAGGSAIAHVLPGETIMIQNSIHLVRANKAFAVNEYLYYWMYSLVKRGYMEYCTNVATIPHYTKEKLSSTLMPLPSVVEQERIVKALNLFCKKIDSKIEKNKQQICLLQELRTRLISDVVTGQMDVRDIAVPEYEYVEETSDTGQNNVDEPDELLDGEVS